MSNDRLHTFVLNPPEWPGVVLSVFPEGLLAIRDYNTGQFIEVPFFPPPTMDMGEAILEAARSILES